jgi:hypothetical protein
MDFVIPNKHQHPATTPTHNRGGAALPNHPHNLRRGHTTTVSDETTTTNVHIEQISVTGTKRRTQQRKHRREREGERWYGVEKLIAPPSKGLTSCCERFGF